MTLAAARSSRTISAASLYQLPGQSLVPSVTGLSPHRRSANPEGIWLMMPVESVLHPCRNSWQAVDTTAPSALKVPAPKSVFHDRRGKWGTLPGHKLIIQIPCFNEEVSLPIAFACLPKRVPGYDCVETLILDDGSTDRTAAVARELGATHVLELPHRGLAQTFMSGVRYARELGAHTVVNLDADNQYCADDIA